MKIFTIILLATFCFANFLNAQHEILFLNGKKIQVGDYQVSRDFTGDSIITYYIKDKAKEDLLLDVFSVIDKSGQEHIYYIKNADLGFELDVPQMKSYVIGANMARENYKPWGATLSGFIVGAGSILYPPVNKLIFLDKFNITVAPLLPVANTGVVAFISPSNDKINNLYPEYHNNEYFVEGYKYSARQKRIKNTLISGAVGIIAGFTVAVISK